MESNLNPVYNHTGLLTAFIICIFLVYLIYDTFLLYINTKKKAIIVKKSIPFQETFDREATFFSLQISSLIETIDTELTLLSRIFKKFNRDDYLDTKKVFNNISRGLLPSIGIIPSTNYIHPFSDIFYSLNFLYKSPSEVTLDNDIPFEFLTDIQILRNVLPRTHPVNIQRVAQADLIDFYQLFKDSIEDLVPLLEFSIETLKLEFENEYNRFELCENEDLSFQYKMLIQDLENVVFLYKKFEITSIDFIAEDILFLASSLYFLSRSLSD